jgi:hypothetical protein
MRWRDERKAGDEREVEKFLWLPKTINKETRWFETTSFLQRYSEGWTPFSGDHKGWVDIKWL